MPEMIESVEEIGGEEGGDDEGGGMVGIILVCVFLFVCYTLFNTPTGTLTPTETVKRTGTVQAPTGTVTRSVVAGDGAGASPVPRIIEVGKVPGPAPALELAIGYAHAPAPIPRIIEVGTVPGPVTANSGIGAPGTSPYKLVVSGAHASINGEYTEGEPGYDGNVKVGRYYSATKPGAYVWVNWGTGEVGGAYSDGGTYGLSFCKAEVDDAASTIRVTCMPLKLVVSGVNPVVNGEYVEGDTGYDGNVRIGRYYSATKPGEYAWINWGTGVVKAEVGLGTFDLSKCTRTVDNTAAIVRIDCTPPPVPAATTRVPAPVPASSSIGGTPTPRPLTVAPSTPRPITVAPATPGPVTSAPSGLAVSEWRAAPAHRKCFYVRAKSENAKSLEGWYSYRKTSEQEMWYWYKAAYGTVPEARLNVSKNISTQVETVTVYPSASTSASFACQLAGLTGQTEAISVSCYLRQKGGWNAATSLKFVFMSAYSDTCSKVPLSVYNYDSNSFVQVQMDDVWQLKGYPTWFVTDSGRTHVGGPLLPNYVIYAYDGTKLTVMMTSSDKTNWAIYGTNDTAQVSVTPA